MERFVDWLAGVVVHKEVAGGLGSGSGKAKVVLCGHSMGGLLIGRAKSHLVQLFLSQVSLIADAVLEIARTRVSPDQPLWPRVIGVIAFDTPVSSRATSENMTDNSLNSVPRFAPEYVQT